MTVAERLREEGRKEGIEKGIARGREKSLYKTALRMLKKGLGESLILEVTGLSLQELQKLRLGSV